MATYTEAGRSFLESMAQGISPNIGQKEKKWFVFGEAIHIDLLLYLANHRSKRGCWKPGRTVATYPGKDGRTRVVDVETKEGILRRPFTSLLPLLHVSK